LQFSVVHKSRAWGSEEDDLEATVARLAVLARTEAEIKTSMISFVLVLLHFTNLSSSH
jgi:hypothetical protein